jgi:hypothetical protein
VRSLATSTLVINNHNLRNNLNNNTININNKADTVSKVTTINTDNGNTVIILNRVALVNPVGLVNLVSLVSLDNRAKVATISNKAANRLKDIRTDTTINKVIGNTILNKANQVNPVILDTLANPASPVNPGIMDTRASRVNRATPDTPKATTINKVTGNTADLPAKAASPLSNTDINNNNSTAMSRAVRAVTITISNNTEAKEDTTTMAPVALAMPSPNSRPARSVVITSTCVGVTMDRSRLGI